VEELIPEQRAAVHQEGSNIPRNHSVAGRLIYGSILPFSCTGQPQGHFGAEFGDFIGDRGDKCGDWKYVYLHVVMIKLLSEWERDDTETSHQTSLAIKSICGQVVNSVVVPVVANHLI
jgi:hypothetical protein